MTHSHNGVGRNWPVLLLHSFIPSRSFSPFEPHSLIEIGPESLAHAEESSRPQLRWLLGSAVLSNKDEFDSDPVVVGCVAF